MQDAYPVYVKYDVSYTTNLHRKGFDGTNGVNVPNWDIKPTLTTQDDGSVVATVSPDITTTVYADGAGGTYQLKKLEIELSDGTVKKLEPTGEGGNTYSYPVEPGKPYTFVAYYTPIAVVYHLNDSDVDASLPKRVISSVTLKMACRCQRITLETSMLQRAHTTPS